MMFDVPAALLWPLAVIVGLLLGSFANVVALRWSSDKGLVLGARSRCAHCQSPLRWYELVPIISYLVQGGRCRSCHRPIGVRYLLVELIVAGWCGLVVARFGPTALSVGLVLLGLILLVAALVDLVSQWLPDELLGIGLGITLVSLVTLGQSTLAPATTSDLWSTWVGGVLIGVLVIGGLYVGTRGTGMGFGDVKLAGLLGLSLGGPLTIVCLAIAFISGASVGLALLGLKQASWKTAVPFGPFLVFGWAVAILGGETIIAWYTGVM